MLLKIGFLACPTNNIIELHLGVPLPEMDGPFPTEPLKIKYSHVEGNLEH